MNSNPVSQPNLNPLLEQLRAKRSDIMSIATEHGASNIRVFGSVARGEANEQSDIDLLVDLEPGRSLLDHIGLMQDLEDLLGRSVDVVEPSALHKLIREQVLEEAIAL
ncbi:MAG: nucleotidyltransferase family protein [Leptolyngbya sp. RL_3_1]|nr:nucleotidyltransferase family protein [Leptolyngbya sp. RL_3_1]